MQHQRSLVPALETRAIETQKKVEEYNDWKDFNIDSAISNKLKKGYARKTGKPIGEVEPSK